MSWRSGILPEIKRSIPVHSEPRVARTCDSTTSKSAKVTFSSNSRKRAREIGPSNTVKKQCPLDTFGECAVNSRDHLGHLYASIKSHLMRLNQSHLLSFFASELNELEKGIAIDLQKAYSRIDELEARILRNDATPPASKTVLPDEDLHRIADEIDLDELACFLDDFHSPIHVQAYPDNVQYNSEEYATFSFV